MKTSVHSLFHPELSDVAATQSTVSKERASEVFEIFRNHTLFNWSDSNNGCEGRADAVSLLLEAWGIENYKGWVFSGNYLKNHPGTLKQNWKYHVAATIPVMEDGEVVQYVIDPATGNSLQRIQDWAVAITHEPHSYYFTRQAHWYIFPVKIHQATWNMRNNQNRKWMIQCLAGINSMTATGKAALCFNKRKIKQTLLAFEQAKRQIPVLPA